MEWIILQSTPLHTLAFVSSLHELYCTKQYYLHGVQFSTVHYSTLYIKIKCNGSAGMSIVMLFLLIPDKASFLFDRFIALAPQAAPDLLHMAEGCSDESAPIDALLYDLEHKASRGRAAKPKPEVGESLPSNRSNRPRL